MQGPIFIFRLIQSLHWKIHGMLVMPEPTEQLLSMVVYKIFSENLCSQDQDIYIFFA